uniref:Matrix protein n=1 Tax=Rousettus bat paramyxovirus TaxID=3141904 RepID=A0AAU7E2V3_9MONO
MPILSLPADPTHPEHTLSPFPIVLDSADGKSGKLVKQLRVKYLNEANSRYPTITFINTYGFIYARENGDGIVSEHASGLKAGSVTACMMTLGPGPNIQNANRVLQALKDFFVKVRKTSSEKEEIVFDLINVPPVLKKHALCKQGRLVCSAEKFIKNPSKLVAGEEYLYFPTFVSVTYSPSNLNYLIAKPILRFRSKFIFSIHVEILFRLLCRPDSPLHKTYSPDPEKRGCIASVWLHVGNILKNHKAKGQSLEAYFVQKCLAMQLSVSVADLWGPTIIIKSSGHIPKTTRPFFGKDGYSCHPLHNISPSLTKSLWSVGCEIVKARIILQESDINEMIYRGDLITDKIQIRPKGSHFGASSFNPFRKSQSVPNLSMAHDDYQP